MRVVVPKEMRWKERNIGMLASGVSATDSKKVNAATLAPRTCPNERAVYIPYDKN